MITKRRTNRFSVYKIILIVPVIILMAVDLASCHSHSHNVTEQRTEQSKKRESDDPDIIKVFYGVKTIDISTVSGNCQVVRGDNSVVKLSLTHNYKPAGTFEAKFEQEDDVLKLKENMLDSNYGSSDW
jgi:flagellar basal body-associated protein FliL